MYMYEISLVWKSLSSQNGATKSEGTEESFSTHNTSLVVFALEIRLLAMDSTLYVADGYSVSLRFNLCALSY